MLLLLPHAWRTPRAAPRRAPDPYRNKKVQMGTSLASGFKLETLQVSMENVFAGDFFYPAHRCLATEEKCLSVWTRLFSPPQAGKIWAFLLK